MIKNITLTIALIASLFWTQALHAQTNEGPIMVELFTSQGCSSCPPADQIMNQLADNPNFIPISYHVTYWDHLNWKDTLGRVFADLRQRSYSNFKRLGNVYTPQMIINGQKEFVGSRKHEANINLKQAKPISAITVSAQTPKGTQITLPNVKSSTYLLWIAGIKANHEQTIKRGENRGKMVTYKNTVISLEQSKQKWNGNAQTLTIPLSKKPNVDYYVIFAQKSGYGAIAAAGKVKL